MVERNTLIEDILKQHRGELNIDYDKYRNHVYRVFNFTLLLYDADKKDTDALAVAAAFHDIGIWTAGTMDYLTPSVALAKEYIKAKKLKISEEWVEEIILNHHKVTAYQDNPMADAFRRADLVDLSLGVASQGISHRDILELFQTFPEAGFHLFIMKEVALSMLKNPFNPLPIFKW